MTNIENLIEEAMKRHPKQGKVIKISKKDLERASEAYKASVKRITPLIEQLRQDRLRGFEKAHNFIVG